MTDRQIDSLENAGLYERIYAVTRQIPAGKVSTYGQIARMVGCGARQVGYAMAAVEFGSDVPWQRVINSKGEISPRGGQGAAIQRQMLEKEGVTFDEKGRVDFETVGWAGPPWPWLEQHGFHPAPPPGKKSKRNQGDQLSFL